MPDNRDADRHDERTTREPPESEQREWAKVEAGYAYVHEMIPKADDKVNLLWHGWALRGAFIAGAEWQEERTRDAITLSLDNAAQVEVGTKILAAKHGCVSDDRSGRIEVCKGNMIEGCSCRDEVRAVIRVLKEMKR